jgi:hypothetical protein
LRGINDQAIELSREAAHVGANLLSVLLHNALCRDANHEAPTSLKASNGLLRQHEARFLMCLPSARSNDPLYTGVTRSKKLVVIVGQKKAVAIAVRSVSGRRRWSKLQECLTKNQ